MKEPRSRPSLIAVMGCTGAGKSTFIQLVTESPAVKIGHQLKSMTSEVECYQFSHRGRRITLVDTPGFDDSNVSDREILMKLLKWLRETQEEGQKLSGILYLHRIDAPRMQGSALRNFGNFKQLCGEGFYSNIMLGTTCWDLVDAKTVGEERETQLKEKGGFWYALLQKGSEIARVPKDREPARDLVFQLASRSPTVLKSQVEMGTMGLSLDEVSATKTVNEELEKLRAENERARLQEQENFLRLQREREERARNEREKARKRHDRMLREQEEERQRILRMQREAQAQREREMRAIEEQMRRVRIREANEREKERKEAQKRLDDQQFSLDYKRLSRARDFGLIKVPVMTWLKVCGHCARLLWNVSYVECPDTDCDAFTERFRLCMECKPLAGVYCSGGSAHWSGMEACHASEGPKSTADIGSKTCWRCSTEIGPLGFECYKDHDYLCISCVTSGKYCCSGETMIIRKLGRARKGDTSDSDNSDLM